MALVVLFNSMFSVFVSGSESLCMVMFFLVPLASDMNIAMILEHRTFAESFSLMISSLYPIAAEEICYA